MRGEDLICETADLLCQSIAIVCSADVAFIKIDRLLERQFVGQYGLTNRQPKIRRNIKFASAVLDEYGEGYDKRCCSSFGDELTLAKYVAVSPLNSFGVNFGLWGVARWGNNAPLSILQICICSGLADSFSRFAMEALQDG